MANKTFSFRLPAQIVDAIDEHARTSGRTKTDLVVEALAQFYGLDLPAPAPITIDSVQQQLDALREQITDLENSRLADQAELQESTAQLLLALKQAIQPLQKIDLLTQGSEQELRGAIAPEVYSTELDPLLNSQLASSAPHATSLDQPLMKAMLLSSSAQDPEQLATQMQYQIQVFDQIFSAIPELVFICDRMGRFTYISPFGARVWGIERDDLLGKLHQDASLPPEFLEFNIANFENTLSLGKVSVGEIYVPSSSRYYEYTLSPIQSEPTVIVGAVGVALDITRHKTNEIVLQASLERYRSLFELANDMIFIVDAENHQIIDANLKASRRLRYTRHELCQLMIEDIETPESAIYFQSKIVPKLERTGNTIFTHSLKRKNGEVLVVEISVRLIEFGDRLAYQSFARDISDRDQD